MHILYPQLTMHKVAIGIYQAGFTHTDGFYLSSGKHNTCCVRIDKFIIEQRTFIFYIYRSRFHQFKITDNSLNTAAISAGQTITITEAINVYRVSLASSTFISVRAPSYTTNTV